MKKIKKVWKKIVSIAMICCFGVLMVACGSDPNDIDDENFNTSIGMYGTKVLYRPNSYDFNIGSGGTAEKENIYYGQYAYRIMEALYQIYGVTDSRYFGDNFNIENDKLPYLYDSIRYKVDTSAEISERISYQTKEDGNKTKIEDEENYPTSITTPYILIGADTNINWKWSFKTNFGEENTLNAYLENYTNSYYIENEPFKEDVPFQMSNLPNHIINIYNKSDFASNLQTHYSNASSDYKDIILGIEDPENKNQPQEYYTGYSQFTKALEYVVYSYALDLDPNYINVVQTNSDPYYRVEISGYNDDVGGGKTAIDKALEDRIAMFNRLGSYVGLVDRQITKISNWIVNNVIGERALANDYFTVYNGVKEVVTYSADMNSYEVTYDFSNASASSLPFGRDYRNTVASIVKNVCEKVTIGGSGDSESDEVHIDERFLASEIKEYAGDTILIQDDTNFRNLVEDPTKPYIQPLEYQSVTFMFKKDMYVTDLMIALKYDADLNGTEDGYTDRYIDIILDVNFYNNENNTYQTVTSQVCRVYDGPYDIAYLSNPADDSDVGVPNGHTSGIIMYSLADYFENTYCSKRGAIKVGAFKPEIGNNALMTDVGLSGYDGSIFVSQNPLVMVGTTNLRKFYKLIESAIDESGVAENHSYITGKLNSEMFAGSDGCDYLEITYKVIKKNGDYNANYKFYTGIQWMTAYPID